MITVGQFRLADCFEMYTFLDGAGAREFVHMWVAGHWGTLLLLHVLQGRFARGKTGADEGSRDKDPHSLWVILLPQSLLMTGIVWW